MRLSDAHIGLDARLWSHPGIGRYLRELFYAMHARSSTRLSLLLDEKAQSELENRGIRNTYNRATSRIYSLREQWELFSFSRKCDLLHVPHFNIPMMGAGRKLVVTIHDLIYLKGNQYTGSALGRAYVKVLFDRIEKNADAVITVSEYTKNDLLQSFPGLKGRVFVTYEAASPVFKPVNDVAGSAALKKKHALARPFVLFVGSLKRHKNVPVLIDAMRVLRERGLPHELVLVGRKDLKERALLKKIEEGGSFVRWLSEVSDEDLAHLYPMAEAFVLPSLWEGFGLPVLEAMACGAPVLSSDRASLPEVVGTAGRLFDPERVDALVELLYNVLNDSDLRQKMRADGFTQAKKFSWDKTAESTLKVYGQVLG